MKFFKRGKGANSGNQHSDPKAEFKKAIAAVKSTAQFVRASVEADIKCSTGIPPNPKVTD